METYDQRKEYIQKKENFKNFKKFWIKKIDADEIMGEHEKMS